MLTLNAAQPEVQRELKPRQHEQHVVMPVPVEPVRPRLAEDDPLGRLHHEHRGRQSAPSPGENLTPIREEEDLRREGRRDEDEHVPGVRRQVHHRRADVIMRRRQTPERHPHEHRLRGPQRQTPARVHRYTLG